MLRRLSTACALAAVLLALCTCAPAASPAAPPTAHADQHPPARPQYVGLRRSSYGLPSKNADDAWWIARAKSFAASFPSCTPAIIEIVSNYQDDGSTELEFPKPKSYSGPTARMTFHQGRLNHERALTAYDRAGVKAFIQFEPGDADFLACLDLAHAAFSQHPCIIGYGIDGEWYRTRQSPDKTGLPIPDAAAQAWTEKVLSFNPTFTFFIKHFEASHLPPHYRHDHLWFLDDSQDVPSAEECLQDFSHFAQVATGTPHANAIGTPHGNAVPGVPDDNAVPGTPHGNAVPRTPHGNAVPGNALPATATGYQFGYPKDRQWWSKLPTPPLTLGKQITTQIPSAQYLFWVDFTADKVTFERQ